ncbi:DUF5597 domain-containing protein [Sphingomonas rhizophila]|uniref:DUF5597 domain-containing protein n=1 Tax=Sphingomonas rhizophila TaxID=2071607 RepID=UPI001FE81D89|nr:DUF5597 domain-containing protein [Sphingomonas rhizophila]
MNAEVPRLESRDGRHALFVDGAPFIMLGAQVHNSSNYPDMLPLVWPMVNRIGANTVEVPIAWEQVEPVEGKFDFSFVDALLTGARSNGKRLVLLWFGTWKNTSPSYTPAWVKLDNRRFPRMKTKDGKDHYVLSPHGDATLAADKRAFVALVKHLRAADPQNTVIMVQVENETGSYRSPRDYSPNANRLFAQLIPPALAAKTGKRGTWTQAFGAQADRVFNSWHVASYVEAIAAAGKAVKPLPMYVNAALAGTSFPSSPEGTASGGPQQDVLDVWKAAAPSIDFAAPDIYDHDGKNIAIYLDGFARADNALFVPEIGNSADFARVFYDVMGRGGIGFAPFGIDGTGYSNYPLGAKTLDAATLDTFASTYAAIGANMRGWARAAFDGPTWGTSRPDDAADRSARLGNWDIVASFNQWEFGEKDWTFLKRDAVPWADDKVGGVAVVALTPDQFLLTGDHVRVRFNAPKGTPDNAVVVKVEEVRFDGDRWITTRVWNGDQTDYGINFRDRPAMLRVTMGRYR